MDCVSNVQGPMIVIFSSDLRSKQQESHLAYDIALSSTMLYVKFSVTFELGFMTKSHKISSKIEFCCS